MFVLAADYPLADIIWTMVVFFAWVIWLWILITILGDIFRRDDIGGWHKAAWCVFTIFLPFLGVLAYLISNSSGMAERNIKQAAQAKAQFDEYVRDVAASDGPAAEIQKAQALLSSGAITQGEFEDLKRKALAA